MVKSKQVVLTKDLQVYSVKGVTTHGDYIITAGLFGTQQLIKENSLQVYWFPEDETSILDKIMKISPEFFV